jgi:hypothetical protein
MRPPATSLLAALVCATSACAGALGPREAAVLPTWPCESERPLQPGEALHCDLAVRHRYSLGCSRGGWTPFDDRGVLSLFVAADGRALLQYRVAPRRGSDSDSDSDSDSGVAREALRWSGQARWEAGELRVSLLEWHRQDEVGWHADQLRCRHEAVAPPGAERRPALVCQFATETYPLSFVGVSPMPFTAHGALGLDVVNMRVAVRSAAELREDAGP